VPERRASITAKPRCEIAVIIYRHVVGAIDRRCLLGARFKVGRRRRGICLRHYRMYQAHRKGMEWFYGTGL
jgi:collagenase-like PrtC family protease